MRQFSSRLYFILESERIFPLSFQDQRLNFQFVVYLVTQAKERDIWFLSVISQTFIETCGLSFSTAVKMHNFGAFSKKLLKRTYEFDGCKIVASFVRILI